MRRALAFGLSMSLLLPMASGAAVAQRSIQSEPLAPLPSSPSLPAPPSYVPSPPSYMPSPPRAEPPPYMPAGPRPPGAALEPPPPPAAAMPSEGGSRVFCDQAVTFRLADPAAIPDAFRPFIGIFSDAAWTPTFCAALIVENVQRDGTVSIIYAFGPMGSNARVKGGVLHGAGVIRDGELRFQNSDGSQFAFRPLYSDLEGRLTTSQGQSYQAIFKKTF